MSLPLPIVSHMDLVGESPLKNRTFVSIQGRVRGVGEVIASAVVANRTGASVRTPPHLVVSRAVPAMRLTGTVRGNMPKGKTLVTMPHPDVVLNHT